MIWTTRPRSDFGPLRAVCAGGAGAAGAAAGARVVLIHGVGLRAEAWNAQTVALADRFRLSAVDLPGHGDSARLPSGAGLRDYADAVAAGIDATGCAPVLLVGHSMGAMIALDLALRHPHLVCGVAALNAIYRRDAAAAAAVQARAASLDGVSPPDPRAPLERWFGQTRSPERTACEAWLSTVDPAGYRAAYTVFANADGPDRQALGALSCPALFLTGAQEPNSTPAMSQAMAGLAPRARAGIIAGAAHMMPMTHADQVNAALIRFAAEVAA